MASYEKLTQTIGNYEKFADVIKDFATRSGLFTLAESRSDRNFSLKHKDGLYFNFKLENYNRSNDDCLYYSMSESPREPDYGYDVITNTRTTTKSGRTMLRFPLVGCTLINTGSFIAIVTEIKTREYTHTVFGKADSYEGVNGGEFIGGTTYRYLISNAEGLYDGSYSNVSPFKSGVITNYNYNETEYSATWFNLNGVLYPCSGVLPIYSSKSTRVFVLSEIGFIGVGANTYNGRSVKYPLSWGLGYINDTNNITPYFYTNEICLLDVTNILEETIVDEKWLCFPVISKVGSSIGVAYKVK